MTGEKGRRARSHVRAILPFPNHSVSARFSCHFFGRGPSLIAPRGPKTSPTDH
jgi:hypothetical protein